MRHYAQVDWVSSSVAHLRVRLPPQGLSAVELALTLDPQAPLADLVPLLQEELRDSRRSRRRPTCIVSQTDASSVGGSAQISANLHKNVPWVNALTCASLLSGRVRLDLAGGPLVETDAAAFVRQMEQQAVSCAETASALHLRQEKLERIVRKSENRANAILYGAGVYLVAQLGAIAWLTYDLHVGWDIMEPVSYLLGLGSTVVAAGFYLAVRREYTWHHTAHTLQAVLARRLLRRSGLEHEPEDLKAATARLSTQQRLFSAMQRSHRL